MSLSRFAFGFRITAGQRRRSARRWLALLAFLVVPSPCSAAAMESAARWLWYPEQAATEGANQWRFFRKVFTLPEAPVAASFTLVADDRFEAFLNGEPVPKVAEERNRYEALPLLRAGENLLAVRVQNVTGPGGVIAALEVTLASGKVARVVTDASWRVSREGPEGWNRNGFDDSAWVAAREIGDAFMSPWYALGYGAEACATPAERQAREERILREEQEEKAALAFLEKTPRSRAKVAYQRGWPVLEVDGRDVPPVLYSPRDLDPNTPQGAALVRQFRDAGIHLYHVVARLDAVWKAPGEYDFAPWDQLLRKILIVDPEARILLGLRLDAPRWWLDAHKEEWVGYATGPAERGQDQIARFEAASMASETWMRDTGEAVRVALRHLERVPWGRRIIGYQPNYGVYCEWHYYGMARDMPDTGPAMTRRFRAWLRETYRNEGALRIAWKDPGARFEDARVPGREERLRAARLIFRDPGGTDRRVIDYYRCHQRVVADCLLAYCRIVKEETKGRALTGAWYGYHFGMGYPPEGWHILLGEILQSPLVDFLTSPYGYHTQARAMGGDGQIRTVMESLRLHGKLHLYEADTRTHLADDRIIQARSLEETIAAIRREAGHALIRGSGLWWVDFGAGRNKGWFDHPEVLAEIDRLRALGAQAKEWDGTSVSQVALVCDPESMYYLGYPPTLGYRLITGVYTELFRVGAPFDTILLDDLERPGLPDYRVYIFLNCFYLDDAERERITRVVRQKGRTAVWLYGNGFLTPRGATTEGLEALTGLTMEMVPVQTRMVAEITEPRHPLAARLPRSTRSTVKVQAEEPLPGALAAASWVNPRSEQTMAKEYEHHALRKESDAIVWRFRGKGPSWTDIHCTAPLPACDALGLRARTLRGPFSFRIDLVDARGIPWSGPRVVIERSTWQTLSFPLADFDLASYAQERAEKPQFPIRAIKLVADLQPGTDYALAIGDLLAQKGTVRTEEVATLGDPNLMEGPIFAVTDPQVTVLGHIAHAGRRYGVLAERRFDGWTSVVVAIPFVSRHFLAALLDQAGVHRYLDDPEDVLLANRSLLLLHTRTGGKKRVRLPGPERLVDLTTGEMLEATDGIVNLELAPASTRLFRRVPR